MTTILTPAQTCGPLFGFAMTPEAIVTARPPECPGAIVLEGSVLDGAGVSVGYGAFVEFWSPEQACRVRTLDGRFRTVIAKPAAVHLPGVGTLAPQLNIAIFARGLSRQLVTRMYFPDEAEANAADPVLQRVPPAQRATLLATQTTDSQLRFDIRLQGDDETVFFVMSD